LISLSGSGSIVNNFGSGTLNTELLQEVYLESADGSGLEPEISLEVLSDLPDEALEGELADEQLGRLLVSPDLPESHRAGPIPVNKKNWVKTCNKEGINNGENIEKQKNITALP